MATCSGKDAAELYKCINPTKPTPLRWFTDVGRRNGQWYLSLVKNNWVLQPEQNKDNQFLLYQYKSNRPDDTIVVQIQGTSYSNKAKNCIATDRSSTTLEVTNLPNNIINVYIPADIRMFYTLYHSGDHVIESGTSGASSGRYALESRIHDGYCLAFDPADITRKSMSTPVFLAREGDPNWGNRFFTSTDW